MTYQKIENDEESKPYKSVGQSEFFHFYNLGSMHNKTQTVKGTWVPSCLFKGSFHKLAAEDGWILLHTVIAEATYNMPSTWNEELIWR